MVVIILKFVHVVFGLASISVATIALFDLLAGKMSERRIVVFLKCFLVTSASGILFPVHHSLFTHWAAMLGVYVSGVAVLAWRKFHLVGSWGSVFGVAIVILLYLNVIVSISHIFKFAPIIATLETERSTFLFFITEIIAMLPFTALCFVVVNKFRERSINSQRSR